MDLDCASLLTAEEIRPIWEPSVRHSNHQNQRSYQGEWERLFGGRYYLEKLKCLGIKGELHNSRFRSICWRVYLECLPEDPKQWVNKTNLMRNEYENILEKLETDPRSESDDMDLCLNNPLSQSTQSPWNQYFRDTELKLSIQQDVVRTFPEIEFFHSPEIQCMMVNLLFCFARQFPHISYRQGMHELLAPIIFVLHSDQQACLHAFETDLLEMDVRILLNPNYTEHDAYFIFCQLMDAVEGWYVVNGDLTPKEKHQFSLEPFSCGLNSGPSNALGCKLIKIFDQLLRRHDPELFAHLEQLEIVPQIYGIRWLRLLFGREFAIQDLLIIWDAIFASSLSSDLVDYIFAAMLVFIRNLLLRGDFASCLSHLMRYPAVADVRYIIELALHLKDPSQYNRPVDYLAQMLQHVLLIRGKKDIHQAPLQSTNQPSGASISKLTKQGVAPKFPHIRPKTLALSEALVNKPFSEPTTLESSPPSEAEQCEEFPVAVNKSFYIEHDYLPSHHHQKSSKSAAESCSGICPNVQKPGSSSSLPRAKIKGIMENDDHNFKASVFSHSLSHLEDERSKKAGVMGREMLPLVPQSGITEMQINTESAHNKIKKNYFKNNDEEIKYLRAKVLELQQMTEYSGRRMTLHLDRLQECMVHQELKHEDEMLIALAGLKRIRDILKGTVSYIQEVSEEDDCSIDQQAENLNTPYLPACLSDHETTFERFDSFVVVEEEMCNEITDIMKVNNSAKTVEKSKYGSSNDDNAQCCKSDTNSTVVGSSLQAVKKELCKFLLRPEPLPGKEDQKFPSC